MPTVPTMPTMPTMPTVAISVSAMSIFVPAMTAPIVVRNGKSDHSGGNRRKSRPFRGDHLHRASVGVVHGGAAGPKDQ